MKKIYSFIACCIVCVFIMQHRMAYVELNPSAPLKVTDWDCLGYYMYLPGTIIYNDLAELKWMPEIDARYQMSGGEFYQAGKTPATGKYVGKYLGGIAIMQIPFFVTAHWLAGRMGYPADGFSPPYQWAVALAAIFYALLGLFLLRRFLLYYFNDLSVAISLLLLCLATNFIQYVAVDGGMSHAYIFPLYAVMLLLTKKWHKKPTVWTAAAIGYIIGLATISRPTEAVMLFIPLMWNTHTKDAAKVKWAMVKAHRMHVAAAILAGLAGIAPQLLYWKAMSGSFIYDVGSAWDFLTPHLRVLFGWEKGWFIYTPVTVLFIAGMFFIKGYPFRKSVLWFCLLNIYIIISWRDWQYGGSYSTRALMQSYPLFALPFTALVQYIGSKKWRYAFYALGIYLVVVNVFQHDQYFKTVLHYRDMNRKYYGSIYLAPNPTPLDMSLLDNEDLLKDEGNYTRQDIAVNKEPIPVQFAGGSEGILFDAPLPDGGKDEWLRIDCTISAARGYWGGYLNTRLYYNGKEKDSRVRLFNAISTDGADNAYAFYVQVPEEAGNATLKLFLSDNADFEGVVKNLHISRLTAR